LLCFFRTVFFERKKGENRNIDYKKQGLKKMAVFNSPIYYLTLKIIFKIMKKLSFLLMICSFFAATSVFGQQWNGAQNSTGAINRNGLVGIGIGNPTAQLHIKAPYSSYPATFALENSAGKYTISSNYGGYFDIDYAIPFLGGTMAGKAISIGRFGTDYSVTIDLKQKTKFSSITEFSGIATFNNTVLIQNSRLLLSDGANQIELNSDGLIHAREIEVDFDVIPDYVFADDYNLMPLAELQKFIDLNHHLPNVKSADEYEAYGSIPLKELNLKLLEKVEELTLYTLEQQTEIEALKAANEEIESLKKQMAAMQVLLEKISSK
jgi:hypothetical protein